MADTDARRVQPRPFSFAVQAAPAKHAQDWAGLARKAEELGYRALLVPDHQGSGGPLTAMAVAAAVTTTLKIGSLVLAVDFHNPVVLGQELVTLAAMHPGRLEVGLGAGWMIRDYRRTGVPMQPAKDRIQTLAEFVTLLRELWQGGPVTGVAGRYRPEGAIGAPQPPESAPCIVLGGGGRRMLRLAAEQASIVNLGASMSAGSRTATLGDGARLEAFDRRAAWVREAAGGGKLPELQCLAYETHIVAQAREYAEKNVCDSFGLAPSEVLASPLALVGTAAETGDKLLALRARLGVSYWVIKSSAMDDFAPVVARLSGS